MKKLKFIFCFILLTLICIIGGNINNIYAYTTINSQTLFTPSTFDTLVLNYTTLPEVSVTGNQGYELRDGTCSSGSPNRGVYYNNTEAGQTLDSTVTVKFNNCGTLNGKAIDMKLIYSDIVTNNANARLYWSAFGSTMLSSNEWWYGYIEHVNVDIYFYYHGQTTPININTAYLSIFSEDTNEGSGSSQISEAYLYTTTNMKHADTITSINGSRKYTDVYYGTKSGSTEAGSLNCVSFKYNNKDHLNIKLYGINGSTSIGYHLQYTPLTAVVPSNPVKTVSKTEAQLGNTLTYTVEQQISTCFDDSFHYSSLVFTDVIDKNLTYNSLRVYNENGNDVTNSAGTTSYDSTSKRLTYTFNTSYLQNNMNYNGKNYKFVISTTVNHSVDSSKINNSSSVKINNQYDLKSNTVTTTLKSRVNVHYVNMQGVKIANDEVINGNILDSYTTQSKNINGYRLIRDTGNTKGNMTENEINVTYTYDIIRSSIQINKTIEETDSTQRQNLSGAIFKAEVVEFAEGVELANPDRVYYSTKTDANGHCVIDGLPYGTYKITESTVPNVAYNGQFYLNGSSNVTSSFNVKIAQENSYEYSIEDVAKKMQIVIYKEDAETGTTTQGDAHLEGAEYTIYRDENCTDAVETVTIQKGADGKYSATSGWYLVGTYYVKETKAPEGYLIDEKVYPVVQDPAGQTTEYTTHTITSKDYVIRNDIEIVKNLEETDSTEKQSLAGAVFSATLNSDNSKVYYSTVTDENGYCIIEDLPYGTYTVRESTIPDTAYNGEFYIGNSGQRQTTFEQFIEVDDSTNEPYRYEDITDVAKKMQIVIYKEDSETGNVTQGDAHLEGAEYTIYRDETCTDAVETVTIAKNEDGTYSATSGWYLVGTYYVKETKAPEGYLIDEKVYPVVQDPAGQTIEYTTHTITSKEYVIRNDIEIVKNLEETDSTEKQSLAGAVFSATLNSDNSKVYYSTVTDENGYCIIEDLPYGTYTVRESTIPDTAYNGEFYIGNSGQRQTTFEQFIEVDDSTNEPYRYEDITDVAKKMQIVIYKEDSETGNVTQGDAHLEGAEYTIYRDETCTDAVETVTIAKNEDGTYSATSGWYLVGTYYVKETKAPEGYLIDEKVYPVVQDPAGQTTEYTTHTITSKDYVIRNDIEIVKNLEETDSTEKQSLAGAVFSATLNSDNSKVYYSTVTDENGYCIIEDLPYGTYTVRESTIPDTAYNGEFYIGNSGQRQTTFEQFIEVDDSTNEPYRYEDITDVAKKMQIVIYKEDSETGNVTQGDAHLEGAEYTIYRDETCTDAVETVTIAKNEDGTYSATSGWYLVGKYYVKETKAPEGYLIDEKVYPVVQVPAEQTTEHTTHTVLSKDKVMEGLVRVIKYNNNSSSTDKEPATGAIIRLTLNSNENIYYEATVDENGYFEFIDVIDDTHFSSTETHCYDTCYPYTIPYGKYTISEIKSSDSGEHIFIKEQPTEIVYNEQIQEYILSDEYVRMSLTIEKYDEETKNKIPAGATFKIWDVNNQKWYEEMSYPSGEYISEFTTNSTGSLTINRHLEAGSYILYETKAPEGYYLDEDLREGSTGYEFSIGVNDLGEVIVTHNGEEQKLEYEIVNYDNIPTKIYKYTAKVDDIPQKAIVEVEKLADQVVGVQEQYTEYGKLNTPQYEKKGLENATFQLIAAENIVTPDGTTRYTKGQVVSNIITNNQGIGRSQEIYLGKYILKETSTPNGYILNTDPIEINIEYTSQYEKVQVVKQQVENKKQEVNLEFEKVYKQLEESKFKFDETFAIFGVYTKTPMYGYDENIVLSENELVDILETDENNMLKNNVNLPQGDYYVKELYVSNPYGLEDDIYEFKVEYTNTDDNLINVTVNNGKIENIAETAELEIIKFSDVDYEKLNIDEINDKEKIRILASEYGVEGAIYKVFNDKECTDPVITVDDEEAQFITDKNGTIKLVDMPYGTYYFKEIEAPYGYELSNEIIEVKINDKNSNLGIFKVVSDPLKRADLLQKIDTFTKDVISGCEFEIYSDDGRMIYSAKTDENGKVQIPIIYFENGEKYYYKEVSAPDMYQVEEEAKEFIAEYDEEKCEWKLEIIDVGNDRKTIEQVILRKTDRETGEPLQGCEFTIVLLDENGEEYVNQYGEKIYLVEKGVTNEEGEYVIKDVPYGTYRFVEIKAPEGYELDEDITGLEFTVDERSGDILIFEVTNTGDIAIVVLTCIAIISLAGITFVIARIRKQKQF